MLPENTLGKFQVLVKEIDVVIGGAPAKAFH
jgi:hypothetical protein